MTRKFSILFDSYYLYHLPQYEPLIDLLSKDDRFTIYHSVSRNIDKKEYELSKNILDKKPGKFIEGIDEADRKKKIKQLDLDVFICGWSRYPIDEFVSENTIVGMIYHGIGIKPSYWRDNHDRLDIRFVEGPYRIRQLKDEGIKTESFLTGFIKLDPLFSGKININNLIKELEIDKSKKTILFAPTFYPSSLEILGLKLGEYTRDFNLLIKPHAWTSLRSKFADINLNGQRKLLLKLNESFNHIKIIPPDFYNIIPLYKLSDLLITEASSTIYEMISLDKPVLVNRFFKLKLSHRLFKKRLYYNRLNDKMHKEISEFCFEAHKPENLPFEIDNALNNTSSKLSQMQSYKDKMFYKLDGNASIRARDKILEKLSTK